MATRSAIGHIRPDGSIRAVYCHWDGSPSHQLPILTEHYGSVRKVQALIKPGSMSSLRTAETWASDYPRDAKGRADFTGPRTNLRDPQPLYHHERGAGPWCAGDSSDYAEPPRTAATLGEALNLWRDYGCEYLYAFSKEDGWHHYAID